MLSKAACVMMSGATSFPSTPTPLFPSSSHPSPQWRGGMQGRIPGLMKLILQESRPKWSLNQHHKNKRPLVEVVHHTRLPRHFNVFVQRKNRNARKQKVQDFVQWLKWIMTFNYTDREGWNIYIAFWQKTFSTLLRKQTPPRLVQQSLVVNHHNPKMMLLFTIWWIDCSTVVLYVLALIKKTFYPKIIFFSLWQYCSVNSPFRFRGWGVNEEWTYPSPLWGQRNAALWFQEALLHG